MRRGLLVVVALLFVVSVPWYRDGDAPAALWLGLPDWVSVALLCYGLAALLNAAAWLLTDLGEDEPEEPR